jgi:hypothetical protein
MARSRVLIQFVPEEYNSFVRAIPNEPRLPPTYDKWLERCAQLETDCLANGIALKPAVVHYQTFANYSRDTGLQLCYELIEALAVAKAAHT